MSNTLECDSEGEWRVVPHTVVPITKNNYRKNISQQNITG